MEGFYPKENIKSLCQCRLHIASKLKIVPMVEFWDTIIYMIHCKFSKLNKYASKVWVCKQTV